MIPITKQQKIERSQPLKPLNQHSNILSFMNESKHPNSKSLPINIYYLLSKVTKDNIIKILAVLSSFVDLSKTCNIIECNGLKVYYYLNEITNDGFYQVQYQNKDNCVLFDTNIDTMDCCCARYVSYMLGDSKNNICEHIVALKIMKKIYSQRIHIEKRGTNLSYINAFRIKSRI